MTAHTAPHAHPDAINIDSVVCTCCGARWWPEGGAPLFPEAYICDVCEQWFGLYQIRGELPVTGPAHTLRRALAGQPITYQEYVTDQSPWVMVAPAAPIREMVDALMKRALEAADDDEYPIKQVTI